MKHFVLFPYNLLMMACTGMMIVGLWIFIAMDRFEFIKKQGNCGDKKSTVWRDKRIFISLPKVALYEIIKLYNNNFNMCEATLLNSPKFGPSLFSVMKKTSKKNTIRYSYVPTNRDKTFGHLTNYNNKIIIVKNSFKIPFCEQKWCPLVVLNDRSLALFQLYTVLLLVFQHWALGK